jgi:hypothetical protein
MSFEFLIHLHVGWTWDRWHFSFAPFDRWG